VAPIFVVTPFFVEYYVHLFCYGINFSGGLSIMAMIFVDDGTLFRGTRF